jgi:hypothetical protein
LTKRELELAVDSEELEQEDKVHSEFGVFGDHIFEDVQQTVFLSI